MLTRIAFVGDEALAGLAADHARAFAALVGLGSRDGDALSLGVAEAVRFAFAHAYPGEAAGELEVTLEAAERGVRVAVHDWGRPLRSGGGELGPLPAGLEELDRRVEGLRLLNLGGDGKRLSFLWPATVPKASQVGVAAADEPPRVTRASADPTADRTADRAAIQIRNGRVEDAEGIAQLLYASYGLHYLHGSFYQPGWLATELAAGRVLSTVAVHGGQVVGHEALLLVPGTPAAETGVAAVLPAYRGLGLLARMDQHTLDRARDAGLASVFARSVIFHPYSQLALKPHGFIECALCLAALPPSMDMRSAADGPRGRTALLVLALPLADRARRSILPALYRDRLAATYDQLGLRREEPADHPMSEEEPLTVTREGEASVAELRIAGWGAETPHLLRRTLRELVSEHVDAIYADVDLEAVADPDGVVAALEELGFSYAGLWPDGSAGHDHLRMQRLNSLDVVVDGIVCASPEAEELRRFVLADRRRVAELT
jgi:anti-sigma regulatory factor (Ser/Thr protein kinase)/N-acetylglutamate synthase-like GNAT family acetyltransferase